MAETYVNWGNGKVKLTWERGDALPPRQLITSVHGFCFYQKQLLLVKLKHRGWDFPGGHIEEGETPERCFQREALEEGYATGKCQLLGWVVVDHGENPNWDKTSPYPKVGYQVYYRMEIEALHPFGAEFESVERQFISPEEISNYYHGGWRDFYQEILDAACHLEDGLEGVDLY
ncbi:NUDIX domain-containing protein [Planomicrobium chinense]|uniref:NUDIX hydrolase n=1 Tax=Planococcus chinensis TaxID=272917 RepID=UPI001CC8291E|nr:NUDIX domain-containing protein [Planococcus chinensis]MBZ5201091.1 NUDIX domain-containing protein [Planococcus chinensis]